MTSHYHQNSPGGFNGLQGITFLPPPELSLSTGTDFQGEKAPLGGSRKRPEIVSLHDDLNNQGKVAHHEEDDERVRGSSELWKRGVQCYGSPESNRGISEAVENVSSGKYPAGSASAAMEPHSGRSGSDGCYRKKMRVEVPTFIDFLGVGHSR
ncbi:hypothetical protein SAY86_024023 [Trapa natans]|uniref:Uncharacterized protein n=1 Tax=Trapa natans TaxID=22666 RepID=A0AAN7LQT9_TRANT|nr:hypothetical protein SAY86_024023 [Trapa natans]